MPQISCTDTEFLSWARARRCVYGLLEDELKNLVTSSEGLCFYCGKELLWLPHLTGVRDKVTDKVTIEHLIKDGEKWPDNLWNLVLCCHSCNSSRRKPLFEWLKKKKYLERVLNRFIDSVEWIFAKTMAESPHHYIVRDRLDKHREIFFDIFSEYIDSDGKPGTFNGLTYRYIDLNGYKYWKVGTILNREIIKTKNDI